MSACAIVAVCACAVAAALPAPADAAIALRDAQSASTGSSPVTTLTIPALAGLAVGDVMIASIAIRVTGNTITAPAGWTAVAGLNNADSLIRLATFSKVATSADVSAGSFVFGLGTTITRGAGGIAAYSGVDTAAPIDVAAAATSNGAPGLTATAPAVTATNLRATVLVATAWQGSASVTPAAGTTERYENASTAAAANNATAEAADFVQSAPGSTGARTVTSSVSLSWVAHTVALNEMPELTTSFPSDYAWPSLVPATTATSAEQTMSVTSNRSWGLKIASDRSDGRSRQWSGSAYGSLALADPLQWRTTSIGGSAQSTTFANLSDAGAKAVTGQPPSAGALAVGVTFRQQVSYADEAALPIGNTYRQNVSYTAQQGF